MKNTTNNKIKEKNIAIMEQNKADLRDLEDFYINGTVNDLIDKIETIKHSKIEDMKRYAEEHQMPIYDKYGEVTNVIVEVKPIVINNYFFKSICPLGNKIPMYNAEKLGIVFEYYQFLITEINDRIGNYPPSLSSFCKLAGITTNTLKEYKNSSDIEMRNVVEKIYDQFADDNLTMSQMGRVREKSTIFKLETQHDMLKKVQPNVNITYKEVINTDKINENLEKYKALIGKKEAK